MFAIRLSNTTENGFIPMMEASDSIITGIPLDSKNETASASTLANSQYLQALCDILANANANNNDESELLNIDSFLMNTDTGFPLVNPSIELKTDSLVTVNPVDLLMDELFDSSMLSSSDLSMTDVDTSVSSMCDNLIAMSNPNLMFDNLPIGWDEFNFEVQLSPSDKPSPIAGPLLFDPKVMKGPRSSEGPRSSSSSSCTPPRSPKSKVSSNSYRIGNKKVPIPKQQTANPNTNTPKKRKATMHPESPARAKARYDGNVAKIAQNRQQLMQAGELKLSNMPFATPGDIIHPPRDYRLWDRRLKVKSSAYRDEAHFVGSKAASLIPINFEVIEVQVAETAKKHPVLDRDTNISFENPVYKDTIPKLERLDLKKYRGLPLYTSLGQQVFVKPIEYRKMMDRMQFANILRAERATAC